ncbi:MAG: hydrogenase maturation nickel metallochaperone HypA [Chloroflexi bacterium]|nr:hydrogenase maturation nickel metallochaperone HypA [Chloroflexota bacterium]MBI5956832.1 hydrogenase maturation nickel metallochaperone HypA [Chloroflexota bacterium]
MHELPVTENILAIALEEAARVHASKVTAINLVVGDMASIVDDSVQFYFDFLSKDTPAAGAALNFRRVPPQLRCGECDQHFDFRMEELEQGLACPHCGGSRLEMVSGTEFYVESIDVDE